MIREGKVESLILTEKEIHLLSNGNYIVYEGCVGQVLANKNTIRVIGTQQEITLTRDQMSTLRRIVVVLRYGKKPDPVEIRRFPLKFEQWQHVIDKKLLDSGRPVSFEVLQSSYASEQNANRINTFIAVIISGKQKYTYSATEVKLLIDNAMYHAVSTAVLDYEGAFVINQEDIDKWWEYNKYLNI